MEELSLSMSFGSSVSGSDVSFTENLESPNGLELEWGDGFVIERLSVADLPVPQRSPLKSVRPEHKKCNLLDNLK
jgi:hypothetical protein